MAYILLVEDNADILKINAAALKMRGYSVRCATTLAGAQSCIDESEPVLVVLDVMLPDGNGVAWCRALRAKSNLPVLFLSALGENEDVIAGLKAGGDDYMPKPYDLEVLIARIEARLRSHGLQERFLSFGGLKLDAVSLTAYLHGEDLLLTQKEFSLLLLLVKNAERVVDKAALYESVWGQPMGKDPTALYTAVSRLKKKLRPEKNGLTVTFQRSEGYLLERL